RTTRRSDGALWARRPDLAAAPPSPAPAPRAGPPGSRRRQTRPRAARSAVLGRRTQPASPEPEPSRTHPTAFVCAARPGRGPRVGDGSPRLARADAPQQGTPRSRAAARRRPCRPAGSAGSVGQGAGGRGARAARGHGVKCVLVGDGAVGKTSLVVSYTTNGYPTEYIPTAFDNFSAVVSVDGRPVKLQLCDTAGQDEFDKLRPLCYTNADIFLLCFSVVGPSSFQNVSEKWVPEIRGHCPKAPIVLVGTQSDLREDVKVLIELDKCKEKPVPEEAARLCAEEIKATSYIECSALTQKNLKEVFDAAIVAGIQYSDSQQQPKKSKSRTPTR
uniref:Ras homolog family member U n=1 Tax=Bos mutus grunniens TaxID=30521 RepID=A0A8C0AI29_BOSMU